MLTARSAEVSGFSSERCEWLCSSVSLVILYSRLLALESRDATVQFFGHVTPCPRLRLNVLLLDNHPLQKMRAIEYDLLLHPQSAIKTPRRVGPAAKKGDDHAAYQAYSSMCIRFRE